MAPRGTQALAFLTNVLQMEPVRRLSFRDALEHPYFERYHDPADEPDCEKDLGAEFVRSHAQPLSVCCVLRRFGVFVCRNLKSRRFRSR